MNAKMIRWGNSQGVRIPKSIIETLEISFEDELEMNVEEEAIVIRKKKKRKSIVELFEGFESNEIHEEVNFGEVVGKELW